MSADEQLEIYRNKVDAYIDEFEDSLVKAGESDEDIANHVKNINFYLGTYVPQTIGILDVAEGCYHVDDFLGSFFIRQCAWSTPQTIEQNADSFKRFYRCMVEAGHVSQEDADELTSTIDDLMPMWKEDCEEFNSPSKNPFGFDMDSELFSTAYDAVARAFGLQDLFGLDDADGEYDESEDELDDEGDSFTREEVIDMLTMALFYLTSWKEKDELGDADVLRAWKSADWDSLDRLRENDFISCTNKAKSVYLTKAGEDMAVECLQELGFDYLV